MTKTSYKPDKKLVITSEKLVINLIKTSYKPDKY